MNPAAAAAFPVSREENETGDVIRLLGKQVSIALGRCWV